MLAGPRESSKQGGGDVVGSGCFVSSSFGIQEGRSHPSEGVEKGQPDQGLRGAPIALSTELGVHCQEVTVVSLLLGPWPSGCVCGASVPEPPVRGAKVVT